MSRISVIIPAAGQSRRFRGAATKKTFFSLHGKPVWAHAVEPFRQRSDVVQIIIVVAPNDLADFSIEFAELIEAWKLTVVPGGSERSVSVANGFRAVSPDCDLVAIHDAARPCVDPELIQRVIQAAATTGAAIPGVPINSTLKRIDQGNRIIATVDRDGLFQAQTPQVFRRSVYDQMLASAGGLQSTDDAQLAETLGIPVTMVAGSISNIKITEREDIEFAQVYLSRRLSIDT